MIDERAERVFGIYGYEFTRQCAVLGIELIPLYAYPDIRERARDKESLHLTGYGRLADSINDNTASTMVQLLAAGMTFIEQQRVATSLIIKLSPNDTVDDLMGPDRLGRSVSLLDERQYFGTVIQSDVWAPSSRGEFLAAFIDRFLEERPNDPLRLAFFREIEIARLSTRYVEIEHFLAFSALELLARSSCPNASTKNAAVPIKDVLNQHGFGIAQVEVEQWCRARNKAFHEGRLVSPDPNGGPEIRLIDQLFPLTRVLCDLLLKLLPFDDGHINWNRWCDRMPFV